MTIRLVQGFEHILPTTVGQAQILASEVRQFLGFAAPINTTDWFLDSAGAASDDAGPMIISSDARIDGQSLRIQRPNAGATYNSRYNGAYAMDLSRNLGNRNRTTVGFATKYSKEPEASIPLIQWLYDNTSSELEQASLWVSPAGAIFFSVTNFDITSTSVIAATPITGAISEISTFNFLDWQYIEVDLNYSGATPTATVYINGATVLTASLSGLLKASSNFVTKQSIINPQNTYFPDDAYTMYLDDVYFQDGAFPVLGPQHIVLLEPTSTVQNEFVITGGEASSYLAVDGLFNKSDLTDYISNDAADDQEIFGMEDGPATITNITAVALGVFAAVDDGSVTYNLQFIDGADTSQVARVISATVPTFQQAVFKNGPDGTPWDSTALNAAQIGIEIS